MRAADAQSLGRWAGSLRGTVEQAEAELARPLLSPWLGCVCAVIQMARLCRAASEGLAVTAAGLTLARDTARAGQLAAALDCGRLAGDAAYQVGRAGWSALRAGTRAARQGWNAAAATRTKSTK